MLMRARLVVGMLGWRAAIPRGWHGGLGRLRRAHGGVVEPTNALVLTRRAARRIEHEAAAAPCGRGATGGGLLPTLRVSSLGGAGRLCYER
jgi:hypothetical protein